jgi:hypothetical protein
MVNRTSSAKRGGRAVQDARRRTADERRLQRRTQERVASVEVDAGERERVGPVRPRPQAERGLVARPPGGCLNAGVVLAERIREEGARPPELVLAAGTRLGELTLELGVRQAGKVGMGDGMRADLESPLRERAQVLPGERPQLLRMRAGFGRELGDVGWPPVGREARRGEDRRGHPEALEDGDRVLGDVSEGVVERDVEEATAPGDRLGGRGRTEAAAEQRRELALEGTRPHGELMVPLVRDAVVAEDQRP